MDSDSVWSQAEPGFCLSNELPGGWSEKYSWSSKGLEHLVLKTKPTQLLKASDSSSRCDMS